MCFLLVGLSSEIQQTTVPQRLDKPIKKHSKRRRRTAKVIPISFFSTLPSFCFWIRTWKIPLTKPSCLIKKCANPWLKCWCVMNGLLCSSLHVWELCWRRPLQSQIYSSLKSQPKTSWKWRKQSMSPIKHVSRETGSFSLYQVLVQVLQRTKPPDKHPHLLKKNNGHFLYSLQHNNYILCLIYCCHSASLH